MKQYLLCSCILISGFFTSCSEGGSEIDPSVPFYQNYGIEYNLTDNETHIGANFNKINAEGISLRLQKNGILFNGKEPDFLGSGTYMYMMEENGIVPVTFTFTRVSDMVFVNEASVSDVNPIAIPDTLDSINYGLTSIAWNGDPVGANEFVQVHLEYKGGVYDTNTSAQGAKNVLVNFEMSNDVTTGTLYLSRVKTLPLQQSQSTAGGQIQVSYVVTKTVSIATSK